MARSFSRDILIFLVSVLGWDICLTQQMIGKVIDEHEQPISGVKITSGKWKTLSDTKGSFVLEETQDSILFEHALFQILKVAKNDFSGYSVFIMKEKVQQLDEAKVIQKRMNLFDIGYLPPIRGVQIATGTSTLIQTEGQSGAKSTGNPRELFVKVPGLNIWESDGAGIQMGVGGRGLSPNRAANFNMRQNGYDISADALGYPESYYTPPIEALSSIEIIRGSASLQYGTQFGGLMNFVIKDPVPDSPLEITSRNTIGSFGYLGSFNRISGSKNHFEYQVYHQFKQGNGFRPNSGFFQHQGFAQMGYHFNEKHHLRLEYTAMYYDAQQPGGLTDAQFEKDLTKSYRYRNWFSVKWNLLALHYNVEINSKSTFNVRAFGMNSSRNALGFLGKINQVDMGGNRELIAGYFKNAGLETRYLTRYRFKLKNIDVKSAFLAGARYYQGQTTSEQGLASADSSSSYEFINKRDLEGSSYDFPSQNIAGFLENIWFVGNKLTINAGVRLEYIKSASEGFYKQYAIHPLNYDTLGIYKIEDKNEVKRTVPLFGFGASFKTSKLTSLYVNYCKNYRAVNFNDIRINNPNVIVDSLIRDEYGSTTELGFRGLVHPAFYLDIALFHLFYGDKIGLAPETNGVKKVRTNIGDARNYGVESFMELDFIRLFNDSAKISSSIFFNAAYISSSYIRSKEPNYIGNEVEYVSPIIVKTGLKLKFPKMVFQAQYSYNAGQYSDASNAFEASGDAVIGYIPAYSVLDFSARYQFKKWFQVEAGCNNVINAMYYTRRATAYPGPGILPSDGRNIYVTLQYKFKK